MRLLPLRQIRTRGARAWISPLRIALGYGFWDGVFPIGWNGIGAGMPGKDQGSALIGLVFPRRVQEAGIRQNQRSRTDADIYLVRVIAEHDRMVFHDKTSPL